MRKVILLLFLFAFFFCFPIFISTPFTFPRLDSDYDAVLPIYQYVGNYIRFHHTLPSVIPFIGTGIPFIGDPVNPFFNPLFTIPLVLFDINISLRITIFFVVFFSGLTMFIFLNKLKVSAFLQYWGSFLYMTSGALTACIAAGHITEKFLTYPLIPLFFLISSNQQASYKRSLFLGFVIAAAIYSADIYAVWFFFIFLFSIDFFWFLFDEKHRFRRIVYFLLTLSTFIILSLPYTYLFITNVLPILRRPTVINPFLGSIHFFLLPLQFIVPLQVLFYDKPFFQKHLGFYYNWYEYFGFLGLFPFIFFKNIKRVLKSKQVQLYIILIIAGSLYLASGYFYSPFHWIFVFIKATNVFRVPQRVVIPLTTVIIALLCLLAQTWKNKTTLIAICLGSLIFTIGIDWYIFSYTFVSLPKEKQQFIQKFSEIDKEKKPVIDFVPQTQYFLSQERIPILNYYYAWVSKKTPVTVSETGIIHKDIIQKTEIMYILSTARDSFSDIGYSRILDDNGNQVWQRSN